eukprot:m.354377 g.354377  ORF g.354377 m.354377 type:complete len:452 (+) comp16994_c0_seq1:307-1662(+)
MQGSTTLFGLALCALACVVVQSANIVDFGAVQNDPSNDACWTNARAFQRALNAAQSNATDRLVVVPEGTFHAFAVNATGLRNITLRFDGNWVASKNITEWPTVNNQHVDFIYFQDVSYLTITGNGVIDGEGYAWWWLNILNIVKSRPHLLHVEVADNMLIENVTMRNSPQFHMNLRDLDTLVVRNVVVRVDVVAQKNMLLKAGRMLVNTTGHGLPEEVAMSIPTFPLNTDGIDPAGKNVHIYNCTIENFDDAVAVKPCNGGYTKASCSQDILVENCTVYLGVGMTIGSVPPNEKVNCVRNVTFRNVRSITPIKAIYVKTNPGNTGSGIISNITYENFNITDPLWWSIYIGPQQQHQPDGSGPGCMLYPLQGNCPTQPRVPIDNIVLRNISSTNGLLSPGIFRCNATRPCTGFVFDNVQAQGSNWPVTGYICENIKGTVTNSSPIPSCMANP